MLYDLGVGQLMRVDRAKSRVFLRPNNCHFPSQNKGKNSPI